MVARAGTRAEGHAGSTVPFRLLRDALTNLALPPERQRQELAGTAVTDELALDLENAVLSLGYETERAGIRLAPALVTAVQQLDNTLAAAPADGLWDDTALDQHPVWAAARTRASELLARLPSS
ncbi:hypothetical protein [Kineosporia sp. A_224]|uniref:hypothetical protein n=1 Tax=Kineosporia sp. A_224 TaxID=1962180 RepID=UPI000B4BA8CD|nr:hypothetical protein [Kineosporia sp. A_224]